MTLTLRLAGIVLGTAAAWRSRPHQPSPTSRAKPKEHAARRRTGRTVDPDNAALRIRYEVDSDVDGEVWLFGINSGNGAPIATSRFAGPDRVGAGAHNTQTGETCRGALLG